MWFDLKVSGFRRRINPESGVKSEDFTASVSQSSAGHIAMLLLGDRWQARPSWGDFRCAATVQGSYLLGSFQSNASEQEFCGAQAV